ncbi:MAG: lysophospholipid acyltransferase family protein [Actinobacteria bacterium]|nr:lysophospholipid acyltransferase family protein [Actinomycetota bacterium]
MENNKGSVSDVIDATGELAASVAGLFLKFNPELSQIVQQGTKDLVSEISNLLGDSLDPTVHFLAERMTGEYSVDEFGFDPELTEQVFLPILRVLYEKWFRVEVRGIENLPAEGACLLVANHSGTVALDSLMTQVAVHDAGHRHMRGLGADLVFATPFFADLARKSGVTLACQEDAERLLANGEVVGVWPEGFKGVGKLYKDRYKLQRFGRGGFVNAAVRAKAPIIPVSIVGAEETYPMLANVPVLARLLGLPYFPITPTFPAFGPLGMLPLPSKWIIEFGTPIPTVEIEDEPIQHLDLAEQIRGEISATLERLIIERGNPFL